MDILTTRFGLVTIDERRILTFPEGLPGFHKYHRYVIIPDPAYWPFRCMQSLEARDIAFAVVDPWDVVTEYRPDVAAKDLVELDLHGPFDAAIFLMAVLPPDLINVTVNLAAPLVDGEQVDVPGIVSTGHVNAGRVNINTATVSELDALPGIGPTTAQAIVDYRLERGPFQVIQDIQNVPGIGPATYDKIKDYITVEP